MRAYILASQDETIAVIKLVQKDKFYKTVRLAIAEHYICEEDDVSINGGDEHCEKDVCYQEFEADYIVDECSCTEIFTITETCVY